MYYRRDDFVLNGIGDAIPNTAVSYFLQPSLALATIYNDPAGDVQLANPQVTDGLGHTAAYMAAGYYTIVYSGPQILTATFPDQAVGPFGGGAVNPVQASTTEGTITGAIPGSVFVLPSTPLAGSLVLNANGQVLNPGTMLGPTVGYTISGATVTLFTALQTGDILNANYLA